MGTLLRLFLLCICFIAALSAESTFASSVVEKPEAALRKAFPDLAVDSIRETDASCLYEVLSGQNVFYFLPEKDYLFVGELYNKERQSLTATRKRELASKMVKSLPLEKAVKIGNGKHTVIEFTDPDCPYCRKASDLLRKRQDVTRYVFFAPFAHPAAITKIHHILNSKNKAAAYEEMMKGGNPPPGAVYSEEIKSLAQEHIALARKAGVQGTPTFFINGQEVVGADEKKIEELLKPAK